MRVRAAMAGFAALATVSGADAAPAPPRVGPTCGPVPAGWITSRPDRSQIVNTIVIYDKAPGPMTRSNPPTWNGGSVNAGQLHEYVGITKQMRPVPTLLLVVSPKADCAEVQFVRKLVDDALDCGRDQCVEVAP